MNSEDLKMSEDVLGYSSHDWRKNTDSVVVVDKNKAILKVNRDCKVYFKNPRTLQDEEVDVSRLIRVFVNNYESHKKECKMIEVLKHIDDLKIGNLIMGGDKDTALNTLKKLYLNIIKMR